MAKIQMDKLCSRCFHGIRRYLVSRHVPYSMIIRETVNPFRPNGCHWRRKMFLLEHRCFVSIVRRKSMLWTWMWHKKLDVGRVALSFDYVQIQLYRCPLRFQRGRGHRSSANKYTGLLFRQKRTRMACRSHTLVHPRTLKVDMPSTIFLVHQNRNHFLVHLTVPMDIQKPQDGDD